MSLTLVSFGGWLPVLCTNHRQTDLPFLVNVGVVDLRLERDLRGFKRVLCRENNLDPERPFVIWRVILKKGEKHTLKVKFHKDKMSENTQPPFLNESVRMHTF